MEQTIGQDSVPPSGSLDKSKVLDVKPLRCLVPVFPSSHNNSSFSNAPFVCASPSGPFPPGTSPFYPFFFSQESQKANERTPGSGTPNHNARFAFNGPTAAVPISSFRTPASTGVNGEDSSKPGKTKNKSQKRTRSGRNINFSSSPDVDMDSIITDMLMSFNLTMFDTSTRADGNKGLVSYILMIMNVLRRRITQIEDSKDTKTMVARRPDLKAGAILMNKGIRTNINKRIGNVPGVEVGNIFYFRMEMCLVGLHAPSMAGIDYMGGHSGQDEEPVAVSIVSSGGYEDNMDDPDVLIYSGHGGNIYKKDGESSDQKLERGNLALEKSLHRGNEVRVIRGLKDVTNPTGKIYVYDGLYKIRESWVEKAKSGNNVFKYKLVRLPNQPEAFNTWKLVQQWKGSDTSRVGVILPDLTSGAENIPVSLVNDVDDEKGPAYFTYFPSLKYTKRITSVEPSTGCNCVGGCLPGSNCSCIQKNGGFLPYASNGVLLSQKSLIHECGPLCHCPPNCRNRVTQGGLKVRLEVFRTKTKGWGLRTWDPIRTGAFICEYAGEVIDSVKAKEFMGESEGNYVFDATRTYMPPEDFPTDPHEPPTVPFPLIIEAKSTGNVARFMNHSCSPNVIYRPVLHQSKGEYDLHIAFYALRHLPHLTELTYDYGAVSPEKDDARKKKCLCGAEKCRGYFY